jgi:hypothetical protein
MKLNFARAIFAIMAFASISTLAGCGGDDCTKASDQLISCGIMPTATSGSSAVPECIGERLCESNCINNATCPQLKDATNGMPGDVSKIYLLCNQACRSSK